jgi:L-malate glycosyltransferase
MSRPPINILLVNHVSRMSGGERGLLDAVRAVGRERVSFTVALPPPAGRLGSLLKDAGAEVLPIRLQRLKRTANPLRLAGYGLGFARGVASLAGVIRQRRIDLIHANSSTAQLFAGQAARLTGRPAVWHCRDLVPLGWLGRRMARQCTRCVAISDAVADHLRPLMPDPNRLTRVYNGVDTEMFSPGTGSGAFRRQQGIPRDAFVVAMIGQLVPWKRQDLFLEAAADISQAVPNARFLIVGEDLFGDHPDYCERLRRQVARLGIEHQVVFTGYVDDVPGMLRGIDLLVHPAAREPFGRAVAEAMATAKPVVAVDDAGPSELIRSGEGGILVPADDAAAIARAVADIARAPGRAAELGQRARRRIEESFGLARFAEEMVKIYEEALCASR